MNREINYLIDRYYQVQKHRLALEGQIRALKEAGEEYSATEQFHGEFSVIEKNVAKYIEKEVKKHPMWKWFKEVKGIGPILSAGLLTSIDINKTKHASSVWKYAGMDVAEDGKARSKRKEHLIDKEYKNSEGKIVKTKGITFNPFVKALCWKAGESFVKSKGKYRQLYDTSREFYDGKFPENSKGHRYAMAKRRTVKIFLCDMWIAWREMEGLEVSVPFGERPGVNKKRYVKPATKKATVKPATKKTVKKITKKAKKS